MTLTIDKIRSAVERLQERNLMVGFDLSRSDLFEALVAQRYSTEPVCCFKRQAEANQVYKRALKQWEDCGGSRQPRNQGAEFPKHRFDAFCSTCREVNEVNAAFSVELANYIGPLVRGTLWSIGDKLHRIPTTGALRNWIKDTWYQTALTCAALFLDGRKHWWHRENARMRELAEWDRGVRSFDEFVLWAILGYGPKGSFRQIGPAAMSRSGRSTAGIKKRDHKFKSGILFNCGCHWGGVGLCVGAVAICYRCETEVTIDNHCQCQSQYGDFPVLGDVTETVVFSGRDRECGEMRACYECNCHDEHGVPIFKAGAPSMRIDRRLYWADETVPCCPRCKHPFRGSPIKVHFARNGQTRVEAISPLRVSQSWSITVEKLQKLARNPEILLDSFCKSETRRKVEILVDRIRYYFGDGDKVSPVSPELSKCQDGHEQLVAQVAHELDALLNDLGPRQKETFVSRITAFFEQD